jgi:hypothetical protein
MDSDTWGGLTGEQQEEFIALLSAWREGRARASELYELAVELKKQAEGWSD